MNERAEEEKEQEDDERSVQNYYHRIRQEGQ